MEILEASHETGSVSRPNPFACSEEERQRRLGALKEGRKNAVAKGVYGAAIQAHCEECYGLNPGQSDCGAGKECLLYAINTRQKRWSTTKTGIRKIIRAECIHCTGSPDKDGCTSPKRGIYPLRFGSKKLLSSGAQHA